jgi:hypothetical protein
MAAQTVVPSNSATLLRTALRGNTLFSLVSGASFVIGAGVLSRFTGIEPAISFTIVGIGLILYAVFLWYVVAPQISDRRLVWLVIAADTLWVVGSIILLLADPLALTLAGKWAVGIVADLVATFAVLQYVGLRRIEKAEG